MISLDLLTTCSKNILQVALALEDVQAMWVYVGGNVPTSSSWATLLPVNGALANAKRVFVQLMAPGHGIGMVT